MDTLVDLYRAGLSLQEIARRTGRCFAIVRSQLIRSGHDRPRHKYVVDDTATCRRCRAQKPVKEFPALAGGKYWCRACLAIACQASALKRQGSSLPEYDRLLEEQRGRC